METLLVIDSSGRTTRSITRRLTHRFAHRFRAAHPQAAVNFRDVGQRPPATVDAAWIGAAFAPPEARDADMLGALRASDDIVAEFAAADTVVIGAPIYNFGMPAQLKAYFDQLIRVGRTFDFDPSVTPPYQALLRPKRVVVAVSAGDGALLPGGSDHHLNFLEPHLRTMLAFVGSTDVTFVCVGYEEAGDDRLQRSLHAAEATIDALVDDGRAEHAGTAAA